jgi:hypothetical protein
VRLRLVLPRGRGRAGLGSLRRLLRLAAPALLAAVVLAGCGGPPAAKTGVSAQTSAPLGPAFGLTENNANLLWPPATTVSPSDGSPFQSARERLTALHPRYLRLLVNWAALQPAPDRPPALEGPVDGCARSVAPCGAYAGIRAQLQAVAAQQRIARAQGRAGFEVVLDLFGAPAWAARGPGGCEFGATRPFSRPVSAAGIAGYRALIRSLLALGAREGVALPWWAPWNEPNDAVFVSPQRASCAADAPSLAPAVYAQLAQAMADELHAAGGVHRLLLGELNGFATDSPHRTSVSSFVAALPESVVCLSDVWSVHAYAAYAAAPESESEHEPEELEAALDARGACGRRASIWITEAGAGAPHPGRPRRPGSQDERAGCQALAEQLRRWAVDPRVRAAFQYSFREDPAFPVGLVNADLTHVYPAYGLWLSYTRASARGEPLSTQPRLCA